MQDALTECPASTPICTADWSSFRLRLRRWDLDREVSLAVLGRGGRWVTNLCGGCCLHLRCLPAALPVASWVCWKSEAGWKYHLGQMPWELPGGSIAFYSLLSNLLGVDGTWCPGAVAFWGRGRQDTSLMPTEGEEPGEPGSPGRPVPKGAKE